MCVDREKDGGGETMTGCLDAINEVKAKMMPVLELMSLAGELNPNIEKPITAEELGNLGRLLKEWFEDVFKAVDGINNIYRRNFSSAKG